MSKTRTFKVIRMGDARRLTKGIEGVGLELATFKREEG